MTVWLLVLVSAAVAVSSLLGGNLSTDFDFTNDPESKRAEQLLEKLAPPELTELVVVRSESVTVRDPVFTGYVRTLSGKIESLGPSLVKDVRSYLSNEGPVSEDGDTALLPVVLGSPEGAAALRDAVHGTPAPRGFTVRTAGATSLDEDFTRVAEEDLQLGETVGIVIALVVLVAVLGSVVAGVVPIILAVFSILVALGAAGLVTLVLDLSAFAINIIIMIGLAVGIDYSLFILSRYRQERRRGLSKLTAIAAAAATASRAVFFSGMTVVVALLGLLVVPNTVFRSLAVGAILVVLVAVAASLTLLPAVLALLGDRVNALALRRQIRDPASHGRGAWDRLAGVVMRRPVFSVVASAAILIVLALSSFSMVLGRPGVSTLPDGVESKDAFLVLEREFSGGLTTPVEVVVHGPLTAGTRESVQSLQQAMSSNGAFGPAQVQFAEGRDLAVMTVPLTGEPRTGEAFDAVRTLRSELIPQAFADTQAEVLVGGETAAAVDLFQLTNTYTPIVFGLVLGLSFLLLTTAFRSVVVPLKAIIMNLLSVGAAYGMIVLFFQRDVGPPFVKDLAAALGFQQVESVEAWVPLFLFCILFGLSMDYHVFLLSRIKERFDHTRDNTASVAYGLRTTAGLITGAALIMVAVFGGFAAGRLVSMQQTGFGLAVAVLLDATVVRAVLVPASMKLLGDWNWYLPGWLSWLPQLSLEGAEPSEVLPRHLVQGPALNVLVGDRVDGDADASRLLDDGVGVPVDGPLVESVEVGTGRRTPG